MYTIKYTPADRYVSAHGDLMFVVLEDTKPFNSTSYPDYKYICDVYIKDAANVETRAVRLTSYPRPSDKLGVFNIGNVVRSYIQTLFAPDTSSIRVQQMSADNFFVQVTCRFGEQYNTVIYPELVIDSQRAYFNNYNGRQFGTDTQLQSYLDKALSNRPYETSVNRNATKHFLPFLASDDTSYNVVFRCYNKTLGLITTATYPFTPTATSIDELQQLNVAPQAVNAITPGTFTDIIDYYTVALDTPNISEDSVYRFNIVCERKYEIQTLHFLNKFGGFETKEFTKVSRKTMDVNKTDYGRPPYVINSDGSVSWFNSTTKVYQEQVSTFASEWQEKMQINTDILTDAEYVWLGELVKSPMVFAEQNGYIYPVKIMDTNYEERKVINDRLTNLTINLEFGETFNTQYR